MWMLNSCQSLVSRVLNELETSGWNNRRQQEMTKKRAKHAVKENIPPEDEDMDQSTIASEGELDEVGATEKMEEKKNSVESLMDSDEKLSKNELNEGLNDSQSPGKISKSSENDADFKKSQQQPKQNPIILSVRLMFSPPNSPAQPWHLDYAGTKANCRTIFLNLTKSNEENCTELVEFVEYGREEEVMERARACFKEHCEIDVDSKEALEKIQQDDGVLHGLDVETEVPPKSQVHSEVETEVPPKTLEKPGKELPKISDYKTKMHSLEGKLYISMYVFGLIFSI